MIPKDLSDLMQNLGTFPSVLCTVNNQGDPHITFITWVYLVNDRTIRIALSSDSKSAKNILQNGKVCLMLIAQNKALACYGKAHMIKDRIEEIKFPVSVFELNIYNTENNLFPGGTITGCIPFMHTGDLQEAGELDQKVVETLRSL